MRIAFSPCPNDTFIFHALVHGLVPSAPKLDVTYADIDITNRLSLDPDGLDILKISYGALPWALHNYQLIPCGGALGRGCGPLLLTKEKHGDPSFLAGKRVAVPSERSTAYLLFRLWASKHIKEGVGEIVVLPFHEIMPAVRTGKVDAGLVIHEARFTYHNYELNQLVDLGDWWEQDTGLPIPLGAIIAGRSLDPDMISEWIRHSLDYAWTNPTASQSYIMKHAQEMSPEVAQAHIDLYVNKFSMDLGEDGYGAVLALLGRASEEGLVPAVNLDLLR